MVLAELERLRTLMQELGQLEAVKTVDKSMHYLGQRQQMMRYAHFQAQGYPIGSESVESANKLVVQSRMKQAGMGWEPRHVNGMLAMRDLACHERWTEGWLAIRQGWQQQRQAAADPLLQPDDSLPPVSAVVQPSPASSPADPSASSVQVPILPRGSQEAGTHCWQRPFLRRRSA